ncbi:cAMP-dependent protein kinase inhibitor alpha-like isoform X2 [Thrips palmi]|uniref:cAMP-dependent protein kinase inhibitor alpha-like isoform X2 n=1 Tax=Thrips palmi TaxID=161013 RepID=A0A6P8YNH4_THRPL|nr:cAMP-dependent protein kinase inhibitor alpha-like isoform X2 [Thrips palmi]
MVLKMLAMEQPGASQGAPCAQGGRTAPGAADPVEDFLTTGRTGRRNAMANIMGQHANTGSGDIAQRMDGLAIDQMEAGPSGAGPSGCSETQQATPGAAPEQGR